MLDASVKTTDASIKVVKEIAPNVIPVLDIMFPLLMFFALNADMSQREQELTPLLASRPER